MIRKFLPTALCLLLSPLLVAQQAASPTKLVFASLPKGTQLNLVLLETVSSLTARKGQKVRMAVAENLTASGHVLISAGTPVVGVVSNRRAPIPGKRDGYVWIKPESLMLPDGTQLKLLEQPPGWNACGGMGKWCWGYLDLPFTLVGLTSLLFESHHHPDQPGDDRLLKACWPFPGYTAADYSFGITDSGMTEASASIASNKALVAACHIEFPPVPYNFGYVKPPTAKTKWACSQ